MSRTFTAYIEFDPESNLYVGTIPSLPGAHSQGATLDELQHNLKEVVELVLAECQSQGETFEVPPFVGIQQITIDT